MIIEITNQNSRDSPSYIMQIVPSNCVILLMPHEGFIRNLSRHRHENTPRRAKAKADTSRRQSKKHIELNRLSHRQ